MHIEENIHDPVLRADLRLKLKGVCLEEGDQIRDGESEFGEREAVPEVTDGISDDFARA